MASGSEDATLEWFGGPAYSCLSLYPDDASTNQLVRGHNLPLESQRHRHFLGHLA